MVTRVRNRQKDYVIASQSQFLRHVIKELLGQEQLHLLTEVQNPQELEQIILKYQIDLILFDDADLPYWQEFISKLQKQQPQCQILSALKSKDNLNLEALTRQVTEITNPEEIPATLEINGIRNFLELAKHNQLSSEEKKIIQMLSWGWDLRAISLYLGLKTNTLYNMVSTILSKLQAKNRTQAIVIGLRGGLVS